MKLYLIKKVHFLVVYLRSTYKVFIYQIMQRQISVVLHLIKWSIKFTFLYFLILFKSHSYKRSGNPFWEQESSTFLMFWLHESQLDLNRANIIKIEFETRHLTFVISNVGDKKWQHSSAYTSWGDETIKRKHVNDYQTFYIFSFIPKRDSYHANSATYWADKKSRPVLQLDAIRSFSFCHYSKRSFLLHCQSCHIILTL